MGERIQEFVVAAVATVAGLAMALLFRAAAIATSILKFFGL